MSDSKTPDLRYVGLVSASESMIGFVQEAISSPAAKRFDDHYAPRLRAAVAALADTQRSLEAPPEPAGYLRTCQQGGDLCRAGQRDGVTCPEDSCDIDDGLRPRDAAPQVEAPLEPKERSPALTDEQIDDIACKYASDFDNETREFRFEFRELFDFARAIAALSHRSRPETRAKLRDIRDTDPTWVDPLVIGESAEAPTDALSSDRASAERPDAAGIALRAERLLAAAPEITNDSPESVTDLVMVALWALHYAREALE